MHTPLGSIAVTTFVAGFVGFVGWWLALRYLQKGGDTGGRCGRCDYLVRELPSFQCPECGSDLREVGITAPRRRVGRGWAALLALLLTIPVTLFIIGILSLLAALWE